MYQPPEGTAIADSVAHASDTRPRASDHVPRSTVLTLASTMLRTALRGAVASRVVRSDLSPVLKPQFLRDLGWLLERVRLLHGTAQGRTWMASPLCAALGGLLADATAAAHDASWSAAGIEAEAASGASAGGPEPLTLAKVLSPYVPQPAAFHGSAVRAW